MGECSMLFFEAFENLKCDSELWDVFSSVEVVKVVASRQSKNICIHIKSNKLIHRTDIRKMEEILYRQLFKRTGNKAFIKPYFELDGNYSFEELFSIYFDSILEELKEESILTYHILTQADIKAEENRIIVKSRENCVVIDKCEKLKGYFAEVFKKRFGYDISVTFEYIKSEENRKIRLPAFLRENDDDDEDDGTYVEPYYEFVKADELKNPHGNNVAESMDKEMWDPANYGYSRDNDNDNVITDDNYIYGFAENSGSAQNASGYGNSINNGNGINGSNGKSDNDGKTGGNGSNDNSGKSGGNGKNGTNGADNGSSFQKSKYRKLPADPSVIYGKNFEGSIIPIGD
ncbi:MAG TPA: PolC-type DNA polymerase III N-terminal domain-containing protein, partial [Mobilitalea sp.]|nr:PolC-type DNA polymerase III N-terminal domain-containing protein [Mobilitalea sp.]